MTAVPRTPLPIASGPLEQARHGRWCPKMCTFACPVTAATGADDAVPWSFHHEVTRLADGEVDRPGIERLVRCNGCLACRDACTYDQDVPSQVVAARTALAAAGHVTPAAAALRDHLAAGLGPGARELPGLPAGDPAATTAIVVGHDELVDDLADLAALADRAGTSARFVRGSGAGAVLLAALGLADEATAARDALAEDLAGASEVVVADPDLLPVVRDLVAGAVSVASWARARLEAGDLTPSEPIPGAVAVQHAPSTARRGGRPEDLDEVLRRLGAVVAEAEGPGTSAGPGLALELLDPAAVAAVAARRAAQLAASGATLVVADAAAEAAALRDAGLDVVGLPRLLATHTVARPTPEQP